MQGTESNAGAWRRHARRPAAGGVVRLGRVRWTIAARRAGLVIWMASVSALFGADKSGVTPNSVSLPAGPGSIEGLGESFEPSLNTGTARYGINLVVPPGTAGNTPRLRLAYDAGFGNGALGFGWDLSLPYVQRQTDKGIPRYVDAVNHLDDDFDGQVDEADELDTFIDDSKEELVPSASGFHFAENQSAFIRYRRVGDHWEGTAPDGSRLEFGLTPGGRINDPDTGRVFKWLLERTTDTRGNVVTYRYAPASGEMNRNQRYLTAITYGPGTPPFENCHFIQFEYEDRPDWFEDCRPGFVLRTGKRLKGIVIGTQGPAAPGHKVGDFNMDGRPDYLVRKYVLTYSNSAWGASLLSSVQLHGADGESSLPPARFQYKVAEPDPVIDASGHWIAGLNEPAAVMDNPFVDLLDVNGDALPDLLRTEAHGGAHRAYLNLGPTRSGAGGQVIRWSQPLEIASADGLAWNVSLADTINVAHLADMNGDGRADLTVQDAAGGISFFPNNARLGWDQRLVMATGEVRPPSPFSQPDARIADIDFDKHIDVIQSVATGTGADYRIWLNLGNQQYALARTVPQAHGFLFTQSGVHIADFNGDGVPDVARIRPTGIEVTAGLGHGHFAEMIFVPLPDLVLDDGQVDRSRLADVTGDGLVDLVIERAAGGQLWYWINAGNYTLSPRRIITGMPLPMGLDPAIRWADINGNGTTDLLYADSTSEPRLVAIDIGEIMGCVPRPNLLVRIENGIGRVTEIEYSSSVRCALEDRDAGRPWPDPLPFPLEVVSRVKTHDSLGHTYITEFRYHDGYYDGKEKEFRGFAEVEEHVIGDAEAPTLVKRFHFHTGQDHEALKGRLWLHSAEEEDGQVFWSEESTWMTPPRVLATGVNGQAIHFAPRLKQVKTILEKGHGTPRRIVSEFAYDDFGNVIRQTSHGVEGNDLAATGDERTVETRYATNLTAWIIRLPWVTELTDGAGRVTSRTELFYDDETFSGANPGQVTIGNLTMKREWINPADPAAWVATQRSRYDAFGNAILICDPLAAVVDGAADFSRGHAREIEYDAQFRTFPTREVIHIGAGARPLVMEVEYDPGFGVALTARDFSKAETRYGYDAFGRLVRMIRPGDDEAFPSAEYSYVLLQPHGESRSINYIETRLLDQPPGSHSSRLAHYFISRQYLDGLGRKVLEKSEAEPAPGTGSLRAVGHGAVRFNARQAVSSVLNAWFSTIASEHLEDVLAFEDIEAPGWRGEFHPGGETVSLDLGQAPRTRTIFDALLRPVTTVYPDGSRSRVEHEPLITRTYDQNDDDPESPHFNTPVVSYRDGLGRQIRTEEWTRLNDDGTPAQDLRAWTTRYEFDANDRLTRIIDSQGNVRSIVLDGLQRPIAIEDPDAGRIEFIYDAASNRIETRDNRGQRITCTYDGANRLLTEDYHDEAESWSGQYRFDPSKALSRSNRPDVAYFYDTAPGAVDMGDGTTAVPTHLEGRLAVVWDLSGEEHTSYDLRGRVQWVVKRFVIPGEAPVAYATRFQHDTMDRITRVIYPDNDEVEYTYNPRNLVERIRGGETVLLHLADYLPSRQSGRVLFGNGVVTTRAFDERERMRSLRTAHADRPDDPVVASDYQYDAASNVTSIRDLRPRSADADNPMPRRHQVFAYDDLYRLTQVTYSVALPEGPDSTLGGIQYAYDRIGNLVSQTSDLAVGGGDEINLGTLAYGGSHGAWNRALRTDGVPGPHAPSALLGETLEYDGNGNVTRVNGVSAQWDFQNRLIAIEGNNVRARYTYDYTGRRVLKQVRSLESADAPWETTCYVSSYFEVRPDGQATKFVWNGPLRVARVTGNLAGGERIQRLSLVAGWNLCVTAVDVARLSLPAGVEAAFMMNGESGMHEPVRESEPVPAGSVLWIRTSEPVLLTLQGKTPSDSLAPSWKIPGGCVVRALSQPVSLNSVLSTEAVPWAFNARKQNWMTRARGFLPGDWVLPDSLRAGEAIFVHGDTTVEVPPPDPTLEIRYYHHDHLGSTSVMTDAAGKLVEETAYYPYGLPMEEHRPRNLSEPYKYGQKEQDKESGFHYFESRYLLALAGRFLSPDPLYMNPHALAPAALEEMLQDPQLLNLYAYTRNNPMRYRDPSGMFIEGLIDDVQRAVGLKAQLIDTDAVARKNQVILGTTRNAVRTAYDDAGMERTVFSGHGDYPFNYAANVMRPETRDLIKDAAHFVEVPEGTTITFYGTHGMTISDRLGNAIESNTVPKEQYSETYGPGELVPNYRLSPPDGLKIKYRLGDGNVTVDSAVMLEDLLKPNMGPVDWAACLYDPQLGAPNKVPTADLGEHDMLLQKSK